MSNIEEEGEEASMAIVEVIPLPDDVDERGPTHLVRTSSFSLYPARIDEISGEIEILGSPLTDFEEDSEPAADELPVWKLSCINCTSDLCSRGQSVVLLADSTQSLYSTDLMVC